MEEGQPTSPPCVSRVRKRVVFAQVKVDTGEKTDVNGSTTKKRFGSDPVGGTGKS